MSAKSLTDLERLIESGNPDPQADIMYGLGELRLAKPELFTNFTDEELNKMGFSYSSVHKHFYNGIFRRNGSPYISHIYRMHEAALEDGFRDLEVSQLITAHDAVEEYIRRQKNLYKVTIENLEETLNNSDETERERIENQIEQIKVASNDPQTIFEWHKEAYTLLSEKCGYTATQISSIAAYSPLPDEDPNKPETKVEHLERILHYCNSKQDITPVAVKVYDLWQNSQSPEHMKLDSVKQSIQRAEILTDYIIGNREQINTDLNFVRDDITVSDALIGRLEEVLNNCKSNLENRS